MHVRVGDISALDLAVGMPVQVGWSRERPSLCMVWVRRRIESEAGVEYVLGGDSNLELPGTPSALRSSAYPRRAPRLSMIGVAATARLLREGGEGRSCTLMDLSAYGAQLLVGEDAIAVVEDGTRWSIELVLPGESAPIVVEARLRRLSELASGTSLQVEFERTELASVGQRKVAAWVVTQNSGTLTQLSAA